MWSSTEAPGNPLADDRREATIVACPGAKCRVDFAVEMNLVQKRSRQKNNETPSVHNVRRGRGERCASPSRGHSSEGSIKPDIDLDKASSACGSVPIPLLNEFQPEIGPLDVESISLAYYQQKRVELS